MQWVASTLHTTSEHGVSSITTADAHTSAASSRLNWRPPADLNGLVRFAERRNVVSARVPSHFKRNLPSCMYMYVRRVYVQCMYSYMYVCLYIYIYVYIKCAVSTTTLQMSNAVLLPLLYKYRIFRNYYDLTNIECYIATTSCQISNFP